MPTRFSLGALFAYLSLVSSSLALAPKVDYSLATDKETQRAEPAWNPLAGLRIEANVTEHEPNNACPGQALACGEVLTQASLTPGDMDLVSFSAVQGNVLLLGTGSSGGLDPDTKITLLNAACGTVLATDDDSGPGLFSRITLLVPTTGTYVLRIEGLHAAVTGDYYAYVSCGPRSSADLCGTAPPLPCGAFAIPGTTVGALNDYDLTTSTQNDCTGYATAGADLVYVITQSQFTLSVSYTSTADGALYLITNCSNPRGSCVAGSDVSTAGQTESITYTSTSGGPYYLVLDNFLGPAGPAGDFTLEGFLDCPPPSWVNVAGFTNGDAGMGVAWGDYDNDGKVDLYLSKYGVANSLMRNNGTSLGSVTNPLLSDTGYGYGVAWGDYDNDGNLDLYLAKGNTANKLFHNEGGGNFTEVTGSPVNDTGDGRGLAWADYNHDGFLDLYLVNGYSSNKLFQNDGAGGFIDATTPPLDDTGTGTGVAWGDYDNDGDLDLYVANYGQPNQLFRNDRAAGFTDVSAPPLNDAGKGRGVVWGDYDNDGDLDLYLSNALSANKLFRNDGAAGFADVTTPLLGNTGDGRGVEWGDFDNDGDLDLYLANSLGANKLFQNNGAAGFSDATPLVLANMNSSEGVATADFDDDGDLDIYLVDSGTFDKLFRNDLASGNHWLHVDLTGTVSNRSGIGARIRVVAGGLSQIREVSGGSGYLSQSSLTAEFGLGSATVVDTVEVRWPSGILQDSLAVAADQRIRITERNNAPVDVGDLPLPKRLTLLSNIPDPFNPATQIRYLLPGTSTVSVTIFDARGRAVRRLFQGDQVAGLQTLTWNGTDDTGAALSSGAYVARVTTTYGSGTEKLTLLK